MTTTSHRCPFCGHKTSTTGTCPSCEQDRAKLADDSAADAAKDALIARGAAEVRSLWTAAEEYRHRVTVNIEADTPLLSVVRLCNRGGGRSLMRRILDRQSVRCV